MLELIEKIRSTRSRNEKESLLMSHKDLKGSKAVAFRDVLHYAYHPLKHYGLQKLPWEGEGTETLLSTYGTWGKLLTDLETSNLSGDLAKNTTARFIESLDYENAEVFKMILKKDLRAGFSAKTINKAFKSDFIPIFGAMLASKWSGTITDWVFMSLKLDGLRGVFREGVMYSRNGIKIQGVTHITDYLTRRGFTELDGELTIPGKHFQDVSGELRSHADCPDAIYNIFDSGGEIEKFHIRYSRLLASKFEGPCALVKHVKVTSHDKIIETFTKALAAGYEGLVLKTPDHLYKKGTRSKAWMKVKDVKEEDLKITGFYEGEGKYEGMVGGFTVTRENGVEVKVGSGLLDGQRLDMWKRPEEYIGMIAELNYHEETPAGSLRHPVLKHLRWDK